MARVRNRWVPVLKWTAIALSGVILVVWIGSEWGTVGCFRSGSTSWGIGAGAGRLFIAWNLPTSPPGWGYVHSFGYIGRFNWWGSWAVVGPGSGTSIIHVPLWTPLSFTLGAAFYLWRRDRRTRLSGQCAACGYSLAGLPPESPCPECGKAAA